MQSLKKREDGRKPDELRPVTIERNWTIHAEGSVLVTTGTRKCSAQPP